MIKLSLALSLVLLSGCDALKGLAGRADDAGATPSATTGSGASEPPATTATPGPVTVTSIVPKTERAWGVAIDATNVYVSITSGPGTGIRKKSRAAAPTDPTSAVCTISDALQTPQDLLVDETHVYVMAPSLGAGAIYRAPKTATGGPCEVVASGYGFLMGRGMTKLGNTLYAIGAKKKGTGSVLLAIDAPGKPRELAEFAKPADGLTTDGKDLYFGSKDNMVDVRLMKIAPTGGTPTEVGKGGIRPTVSNGRIYFSAGSLQSVPVGGGPAVVTGKVGPLSDFAVVGSRVWVGGALNLSDGFVSRATIGDPDFVKHASFKGGVVTLAADAKDVYVTTQQYEVFRISP